MRALLQALVAVAASLSIAPSSGQETAPARPWTLMVYGAADNNADGPVLEFVDSLRAALDDDPGMELILLLDRSAGFSEDAESLGADFTGMRVYRLGRETAELLDASEFFPEMGVARECEVDSADPRTLGRFVMFCKERFPARRYGLMIFSHSDGKGMCPDDESGRSMRIPELTDEVGEEASVDLLALELCNMGGIEIAYQWRPGNGGFSADVLIAIPNAGSPLAWHRALGRIRSDGRAGSQEGALLDPKSMGAADFGALVVEEGAAGRKADLEKFVREAAGTIDLSQFQGHDHLKEAVGCYDLARVASAKRAIDQLAVVLAKEEGAMDVIDEIRGPGDDVQVMHYARSGKFSIRPYVDAWSLFDLAAKSAKLSGEARSAAAAARDAVDDMILSSFGMKEGFGDFEPGKNGIFIVLPDGHAEVASAFGRAPAWTALQWYTPLEPADASDPYGRWAFLADGATAANGRVENWFELLDFWYDDRTESPEGLNRYGW